MIAMPDMLIIVSTVTMTMYVAVITHVAITLLTLITRVAMTPVMIDSLDPVMNLLTSTHEIMVSIHMLKLLHVRTMLVYTRANVRMVITVTNLNVLISMSVQCNHVMKMSPAKIL